MKIAQVPMLSEGDKIRIVSPSSEIQSFPRRYTRGMDAVQSIGLIPEFSFNALKKNGHEAGSPQERASDLMEAFLNPNIKGIMASTGGYTSNRVLEHLDFDLIAENPKALIGFSDITALLLAIYKKANIVTFHGPTLLPSFGDAAGVHFETAKSFVNTTMHVSTSLQLPTKLSEFSEDSRLWDHEDDYARLYEPDSGSIGLHTGIAEGILLGGNLDTLLGILPTPYCPDFSGCLLFLEESAGVTAKTIRNLQTLAHAGILKKLSGLIFGRRYNYQDVEAPNDNLQKHLQEIGRTYNIPVIDNLPFGHTEPKITIPLGVHARMDAEAVSIKTLEPFVKITKPHI